MSVYAAAGLLLSLALGRLIERRGAYAPVLAALALMLAGGALSLALPAAGLAVLAGRALEGVGFAVLAIVGPVLANTHASARHLPIVVGLTAAWIPIGQLAAVLLAPVAFAVHGWQALWWLGLALALALALWTWRLETRRRVALGPRPPQPRASEPGADRLDPARRLSLALVAGVFMLWSCQYFAFMTWLPQYLVEVHGLSVSGALAGYALPIVVLIAFNLLTGAVLRAGVPVAPLLAGAMATQAAVWWLLPAASGWSGVAALAAYGAGAGVVPTCLFAMPSTIARHGAAVAPAFGILMTGRNLGVLAGPVLLAEVFAATEGWQAGGPLLGGLTALALVLSLGLALRLAGAAYGASR